MRYKDLTGKNFGDLEVLSRANNGKEGVYWECMCHQCDNIYVVRSDVLCKRDTTCCSICSKTNFKLGDKFHHITILEMDVPRYYKSGRSKGLYWKCRCDCGKIMFVSTNVINKRSIQSCGCHVRELNKTKNKHIGDIKQCTWNAIKHNALTRDLEFTITPEYAWQIWKEQKGQCALSKMPLTMMTTVRNRKQATASLDRIDSTKGYVEGNIQWVHKHINIMKGIHNQEYFIYLCNRVCRNN